MESTHTPLNDEKAEGKVRVRLEAGRKETLLDIKEFTGEESPTPMSFEVAQAHKRPKITIDSKANIRP